jgi:hypothetical protein
MTRTRTSPAPRRRTIQLVEKTAAPTPFIPPFPPSWLNRLIDWLDRQPGPVWVYYAASVVLMGAVIWMTRRLAGVGSPYSFSPESLVYAFYPAYIVGLTHYLDRQAVSALEAFRPAMGVSDAEYIRIRYELTTVPATGAWIAAALGIPLSYLFILAPQPADLSPQAIPAAVVALVISAFISATFLVLILHTIRQLRMVSELHAAATTINLLQPRPTYAFSRLTSRSAIGVLVFMYADFAFNPPSPGATLPYVVLMAATVAVEAGAFLLPLLGMHQRLTREKARLEAEVNESVEAAYRGFLQQARSGTYDHLNELDKALSGLLRMREVIAKLSTWPWQPDTLRWMLAAIVLPLGLRLIQSALERLLV